MSSCTVIVVRPRAQAEDWVAALGGLGVAARALPLLDILPAPAPAEVARAFAAIASAAAVEVPASPAAPVVVFVSPNAVAGCFDALRATSGSGLRPDPDPDRESAAVRGVAWPAPAWAAATGPGTVAALRAAGVPEACIVAPPPDAPQFDSEALWRRIGTWPWGAREVLIVRGNGGRDWLASRLVEAGARVSFVQSYERAPPRLDDAARALLDAACAAPARWTWMFSSSEALEHLRTLAPATDWRAARALASHPRIAERATALGFGRVEVVAPTPAAVAAALRSHPGPGEGDPAAVSD